MNEWAVRGVWSWTVGGAGSEGSCNLVTLVLGVGELGLVLEVTSCELVMLVDEEEEVTG